MGVCPARPVQIHPAWNSGRAPVPASGPEFFPGPSAPLGVGDLLGIVGQGKMHGPLCGKAIIQLNRHNPRDSVKLA